MDDLGVLQVQIRSDLTKKSGAVTISGKNKLAALKLKLLALC